MIRIYAGPDGGESEKYCQLDVSAVLHADVPAGWMCAKRALSVSEFIFVAEGTVNLRANGHDTDIGKNQFTVCPARSVIEGAAPSEKKCSFYVIEFRAEGDDFFRRFDGTVRTVTGNVGAAEQTLRQMHITYIKNGGPCTAIDAKFYSLLSDLSGCPEAATDSNTPVKRIMEYVDSHVSEPLDASTLCAKFNYNTDYMSKIFRKNYGFSVKQYINTVKLQTARRLLSSSGMSVSRVGRAVGFDDVTLFYKYFRYHEGVTPSEYRKRFH